MFQKPIVVNQSAFHPSQTKQSVSFSSEKLYEIRPLSQDNQQPLKLKIQVELYEGQIPLKNLFAFLQSQNV